MDLNVRVDIKGRYWKYMYEIDQVHKKMTCNDWLISWFLTEICLYYPQFFYHLGVQLITLTCAISRFMQDYIDFQ